jgi:hypothetical protein
VFALFSSKLRLRPSLLLDPRSVVPGIGLPRPLFLSEGERAKNVVSFHALSLSSPFVPVCAQLRADSRIRVNPSGTRFGTHEWTCHRAQMRCAL